MVSKLDVEKLEELEQLVFPEEFIQAEEGETLLAPEKEDAGQESEEEALWEDEPDEDAEDGADEENMADDMGYNEESKPAARPSGWAPTESNKAKGTTKRRTCRRTNLVGRAKAQAEAAAD